MRCLHSGIMVPAWETAVQAAQPSQPHGHSVAICPAIHLNAVTVQFLDLWTVSLPPAAAFGEKRCVQELPACCTDMENPGC